MHAIWKDSQEFAARYEAHGMRQEVKILLFLKVDLNNENQDVCMDFRFP